MLETARGRAQQNFLNVKNDSASLIQHISRYYSAKSHRRASTRPTTSPCSSASSPNPP